MAPKAAALPDGPTPFSQAAVEASVEFKILAQMDSPKDVYVTVSKSMWPNVQDLSDVISGKIQQWTRRPPESILKIEWVEPDGSKKWDSERLHVLLAHGFKLVKGPRGEALRLRGVARVEAEAAHVRRVIC